jgi:hypothetical protein
VPDGEGEHATPDMSREPHRAIRRASPRGVVNALVALVALAAPSGAAAAPTITLDKPVVRGDAVSLSATLTSNGSCGATPSNLGGCPANYVFSGPLGFTGTNLWWNDFGGVQPIPQDFVLRGFPSGTYSVALVAIDVHGNKYPSNSQQFQWPGGPLALENIALTGGARPHVAYRVAHGGTSFSRATATICLWGRSGRRLASFDRRARPGLNVESIPKRLERRLQRGRHYLVRVRVRDEYGRRASGRATGRL